MWTHASSAIPLLEATYHNGGSFAGVAVAALVRVGGCEHPCVVDLLDAYEPNDEEFCDLRIVLWAIAERRPQSAILKRVIARIMFNGKSLADSINAAQTLWEVDPQSELILKAAVDHWLFVNLFETDAEDLAQVHSHRLLRSQMQIHQVYDPYG